MERMFEYPTIDLAKTGKNIERIRKEKGITVARICEAMGFENPQSVYKWQRGMTLPSVDNLFALSRLLGTAMDEILVEEKQTIAYGSNSKDLRDAGPSVICGYYLYDSYASLYFSLKRFASSGGLTILASLPNSKK